MTITALIDTVTYTPGEYSNRSDPVRTEEHWDWKSLHALQIGQKVNRMGRRFTVRMVEVTVGKDGPEHWTVLLDEIVRTEPLFSSDEVKQLRRAP